MIAFIYVTSKPPSGHKMRNKSTKSPDRNRLNVIKCKTTETFQTFSIEIQTWSSIQIMYHSTFDHKTHLGICIEQSSTRYNQNISSRSNILKVHISLEIRLEPNVALYLYHNGYSIRIIWISSVIIIITIFIFFQG